MTNPFDLNVEPFPRVFYTRQLIKDGSEYFGPIRIKIISACLIYSADLPSKNVNFICLNKIFRQVNSKNAWNSILVIVGPCVGKQNDRTTNKMWNKYASIKRKYTFCRSTFQSRNAQSIR